MHLYILTHKTNHNVLEAFNCPVLAEITLLKFNQGSKDYYLNECAVHGVDAKQPWLDVHYMPSTKKIAIYNETTEECLATVQVVDGEGFIFGEPIRNLTLNSEIKEDIDHVIERVCQ